MDLSGPSVPSTSSGVPNKPTTTNRVKQVWSANLSDELCVLGCLITRYNHISVSVKHGGNIGDAGDVRDRLDEYNTIKRTVNITPAIQIAFTLFDNDGAVTDEICTSWQFNMKLFEASRPLTAKMKAAGFDYEEHHSKGIDPNRFTWLLISNRIVLGTSIIWLGFNSAYDFAHLVRILTNALLPDDAFKFLIKVRAHFQRIYDVRHLLTAFKRLKDGNLDEVAGRHEVQRVGDRRYAASDSRLIGRLYFKVKRTAFKNGISDKHIGRIFNFVTIESSSDYNETYAIYEELG